MTGRSGAERRASRLLHLEPWSGAAGDMILAALVAAGGESAEQALRRAVCGLGVEGVSVELPEVVVGGLTARRLIAHGGAQEPPARNLASLLEILSSATVSEGVRSRAMSTLGRLAGVEAALHGVSVDRVHLHELGAVDTLVDVVGAFALLEHLAVDSVTFGPVPLGSGVVSTAHGVMPVPAPATLELLRGVPVTAGPETFETTTPTGALLLTELGAPSLGLPLMIVEAVGYGAGAREALHGPNVLRAVVGAAVGAQTPGEYDAVVALATTIDDATAEVLGHLHGLMLDAGALDAWWTPAFMKKGRPGVELTVLSAPGDETRLVELLFRHSTTFGLRRQLQQRRVLERRWVTVGVEGELLRVKLGLMGGEVVTVSPEFDEAAEVAQRLGRPLKDVLALATAEARLSL